MTDKAECPRCHGLGGGYVRTGPDDQWDSEKCDWCWGAGYIPAVLAAALRAAGVVPAEPATRDTPDTPDIERTMLDLDRLIKKALSDRRGLTAMTLVVARDTVEMYGALMVAIRGHRFDTEHIHSKGVYPCIRLADKMLYEAAGLPPVAVVDGEAPAT